jgi:hypothetical protein
MTPRRRRGRPPLTDAQRATESLHLRLSPEDYDRLCRLKVHVGARDLSGLARKVLTRELQRLAGALPAAFSRESKIQQV